MTAELLALAGGLGLFLVGMQIMTEALRALASRRLRGFIARFTTSPVSGAMTGAVSTAAIQSSSATMVTVIGFVGAGLMTFPQALGVIYGANVGTTFTGWIVTFLGLKLSLGTIALPVLLISVLLSLLTTGRAARIGRSLSGFALIFIGLDMMKDAVAGVEQTLITANLPGEGLGGRLLLVLIGAGATMIVQSSSAALAATLVLLASGAMTLHQGAALVIGMNLGTTGTALLVTIGGSRDMLRTAVAHAIYNVATGVAVFVIMDFLLAPLSSLFAPDDPTALVVFHTLFNVAGMLIMLPLTGAYARLIERLVPGRADKLTDALDPHLLEDPSAAMDAARSAALAIMRRAFAAGGAYLRPDPGPLPATRVAALQAALDDLQYYLSRIEVSQEDDSVANRYAAMLHMYDHLHRMAHQLMERALLPSLLSDPGLRRPALAFGAALRRYAGDAPPAPEKMARLAALIAGRAQNMRRSALLREHAGLVSVPEVFDLTDAMRWLQRTAHNADRCLSYAALAAGDPVERPLSVRLSGDDAGS